MTSQTQSLRHIYETIWKENENNNHAVLQTRGCINMILVNHSIIVSMDNFYNYIYQMNVLFQSYRVTYSILDKPFPDSIM